MTEPSKDILDPKDRRRQHEMELFLRDLRSLEKLERLIRERMEKQAERQ